ncbi:MAG TPA: GatB/YqeY domain-containing protein, partial [Candidatus Paceibacterota bacterium]|nr:GatB/YqeY domain-containing protein [Candidatus Paceibacterota bacterium]
EGFLPASMPREEIRKIVEAKKAELGVADKSGMGKLVGAVMKACEGKADGGDVKAVVEEVLGA